MYELKTIVGYDFYFFFSSRRRHTRLQGDWSSDVCSSDLPLGVFDAQLKLSRDVRTAVEECDAAVQHSPHGIGRTEDTHRYGTCGSRTHDAHWQHQHVVVLGDFLHLVISVNRDAQRPIACRIENGIGSQYLAAARDRKS